MDYLRFIASERAIHFGIDPAILKAIITQESNWNRYAIRYEPEWTYLLNPEHYAALLHITVATEKETQKMSWGLGQLMGSVLRELGHEGSMGEALDSETNLAYVCRKIEELQKKTQGPQELFACYNGGMEALLQNKEGKFRNQSYVDSCMNYFEAMKHGE
jgi:hypothetical protein